MFLNIVKIILIFWTWQKQKMPFQWKIILSVHDDLYSLVKEAPWLSPVYVTDQVCWIGPIYGTNHICEYIKN